MLKNQKVKNAVKVSGEVISTGTMFTTSATAMTVAGATVATMATGISDASKLPRKAAVAIVATAAITSAVTTVVTVKKLGFFKKSQQKTTADIERQQIETFTEK